MNRRRSPIAEGFLGGAPPARPGLPSGTAMQAARRLELLHLAPRVLRRTRGGPSLRIEARARVEAITGAISLAISLFSSIRSAAGVRPAPSHVEQYAPVARVGDQLGTAHRPARARHAGKQAG